MITHNLITQKRDKTKLQLTQRVEVCCDECNKRFDSSLRNREKHLLTYSLDLCLSCKQKHQYKLGLRVSHFSEFNKSNKGKNFESRFGLEKSKMIKEKLSIAVIGEKNPMYGKNSHTHGLFRVSQWRKGKTSEQIYGDEKAKELKQKKSERNTGNNNPMFGKPSPIGSGNGWSGWFKDIYFRSLLELSYLIKLKNDKTIFYNGELKKYKIEYVLNGIKYNYFCDFVLEDGTHIEIKPKKLINTAVNLAKFNAAKEKLRDKFKILTEEDVKKLSFDMIKYYYDMNYIKFIERYDIKFKEMLNVQKTKTKTTT